MVEMKKHLLGHIIRSDPQDPMHQVLFVPNSLIPRTEHARRVGKPRAHWLIETYADAYRESGHVDQFHQQHSSKKFSKRIGPAKTQHFSLTLHRTPLHRKFHHRKLRHRKFRHRKRANSRPSLRNNRCLPPFCSFFASVLPPLFDNLIFPSYSVS